MSWTLTTSGAVIIKAGANASSTATASGGLLLDLSDEVESYICSLMRSDVVSDYSSLTSNGKQILGRLASNLIAQQVIAYDTSGFFSRAEAETALDVLENSIRKDEAIVKDDKNKSYLGVS